MQFVPSGTPEHQNVPAYLCSAVLALIGGELV